MYTFLLLLVTIVLCLAGYSLSGRSFIAPAVVFLFPFVLSMLNGFLYYRQWVYDFSSRTFAVVLISFFCFFAVCAIVHHFFHYFGNAKVRETWHLSDKTMGGLPDRSGIYIAIIIFQLLAFLVCYKTERGFVSTAGYESSSLSETIGNFNEMNKFGDTSFSLTGIPGLLSQFMIGVAYMAALLWVRGLTYLPTKHRKLSLLAFCVSLVVLLVSGSRTVTFTLFVITVLVYVYFLQKMGRFPTIKNWKISIIIYVITGFVLIFVVFIVLVNVLGRQQQTNYIYYLSFYLGAPLKNFDLTVQQGIPKSEYFGQYSLKYLYISLTRFGIVPQEAQVGAYPFISFNGYFLGNVYTIFYALVADFGYYGAILSILIIAVFSQISYEIAARTFSQFPFSMILYMFIAAQLLMSFFSCNILQNIITPQFLKEMFPPLCIYIYLFCLRRNSGGAYLKNYSDSIQRISTL